jgi:hypothetical protein
MSLGEALMQFWGGEPRMASFTAVGWHAQVVKLTESQRGYDAMAAAGVDVTPATLLRWLSQGGGDEHFAPTKANQAAIQRAYDLRAIKPWDTARESHQYLIYGQVKIGHDVRDRGARGATGQPTAPLRVEGSSGDWTRIRDGWNRGTITPDEAEDWFAEDIVGDDPALAQSTDVIEFPGNSYTIR